MMWLYAFKRLDRIRRVAPVVNTPRRSQMASSHVNALQSKHAGLEQRLHQEMIRPAPDTAMVQQLKKEKLRLKEEIAAS